MPRLPALSLLALIVGLSLSSPLHAQSHGYSPLAYAGRLDLNGTAVNGTRQMRFGLFVSAAASTSCLATANCPIWWEQHDDVTVVAGRFSVALGDQTLIPDALFGEPELYLGVAVHDDDTNTWIALSGLHRLLAVPRAARTEQIIPPVGSIVAWHPAMFPGGAPPLPVGWVRCDGQTVSDTESPLFGRTVPDLNSTARFLRGGNTSGVVQNDQMQTHTHTDSGHGHSFRRPRWFSNETRNGVSMYASEDFAADNQGSVTELGFADLGAPTDLGGGGGARHGEETRPVNMSVVWIMRVR